MTAKTFAEYIEQTAPHVIRASHYNLAPDAYGLADGYEWAFSAVELSTLAPDAPTADHYARRHLTEGGDWPYSIAAKPSPHYWDDYTAATASDARNAPLPTPYPADAARFDTVADALREGRVLETYCEGDLTAYIFESTEERDEAAERWEESREEFAARILEDEHPHENAEALAPAVLSEAQEGYGRGLDGDELRDRIAEVMEDLYAGEWGSLADYVQDFHESATAREQREAMGELWQYVDWEQIARDWETTHTTHPAPGGNVYVFRSA